MLKQNLNCLIVTCVVLGLVYSGGFGTRPYSQIMASPPSLLSEPAPNAGAQRAVSVLGQALPAPTPGPGFSTESRTPVAARLWLPVVTGMPPRADGIGLDGMYKLTPNTGVWANFRWIYNWTTVDAGFGDWPGYRPMIWSDRLDWYGGPGGIQWFATQHPGRLWLFLNEPERVTQANLPPAYAAQVVASHRDLVKGADTTATWACCGVWVDGNVGIPWLNDYLDAGGPVGDVWHIHLYAPNDCDPAGSLQLIGNFETRAATRGVTRPIVITEFGCLFPGSTQRARDYMTGVIPVLRSDSLVTGWAWWSSSTGPYPLFDDQGTPTGAGQCYLGSSGQ